MEKHGLTRVRYAGDKVVIVSGPVPDETVEGAIELTPLNAVPGKLDRHEKPKPPKFTAPAKPAAPVAAKAPAPTKTVKEGK